MINYIILIIIILQRCKNKNMDFVKNIIVIEIL